MKLSKRSVDFGVRRILGAALGLSLGIVFAGPILGQEAKKEAKAALTLYADMKPVDILFVAVAKGDLPAVREVLAEGLGIDSTIGKPEENRTALAAAAGANQMEIMRFLLEQGAAINPQKSGPSPVLTAALQNGWPDCADFLIKKGAASDPDLIAAAKGDKEAIGRLIASGKADFARLQLLGNIAAANGRTDVYISLVDAIRSLPGRAGWSVSDGAPVVAIARGHRDVVEAMVERGSGLNKVGWVRLAGPASKTKGMREWLQSKGYKVAEYSDGERLIDAVESEDLAEMRRLIKAGVDLNCRGLGSDDWTPLTRAAESGRPKAVKLLLDSGADPDGIRSLGWNWTPLALAKTPEIADMLLAAGANINAKLFGRDVHIIDHCILYGRTDMVKWFIDHGVDVTKAKGDKPSWLFSARKPEIAELLIQHGVDVNAKDQSGETALHRICGGFVDNPAAVARVLLKHGADPNASDKQGFTPVMQARDGATVDVLVEFGADLKAKTKDGLGVIEISSRNASASRMEALLKHGLEFDFKGQGPTMLMSAAWSNQTDLMRFLLDHGVDPNVEGCWNKRSNNYLRPLTAAAISGQYDAAKLLVERGAKIHQPDHDGVLDENAMITALHNRRTQMVKLFWEHGDRSISELCYAISQGAPLDRIQKLLDQGIPADPPLDAMISPLAEAALLGQIDLVKLLIEHGADVNAGKPFNPKHPEHVWTPMMTASFEGQDEIVDLLLRHGAKFNTEVLWEAVWNCHPYDNQRTKDHFEKTIKLLVDAGGLKNLSEKDSARLLCAAIFSRHPGGNTAVVKMLVNGGLSLDARLEAGGKTVREMVHEACKEQTCSTPTKEMMAFLDQLEKKPGK